MRIASIAVVAVALFTLACSPQGQSATCDALPVSGLCQEGVSKLIDGAPATIAETPAGCAWTINETAIGDGSEAVAYRALSCAGVTTHLAYAGGAHSAALSYDASAIGGEAVAGQQRVRIFVSDPADPQKVIRDLAAELPAEERAKCEVQPANIEQWPGDALVIGYNAAAAKSLPKDEPNWVCGEYGLDEDQMSFWLVRQGYAFFFQLGQDGLDFDPGSFTVLARGQDGAWTRKSP